MIQTLPDLCKGSVKKINTLLTSQTFMNLWGRTIFNLPVNLQVMQIYNPRVSSNLAPCACMLVMCVRSQTSLLKHVAVYYYYQLCIACEI